MSQGEPEVGRTATSSSPESPANSASVLMEDGHLNTLIASAVQKAIPAYRPELQQQLQQQQQQLQRQLEVVQQQKGTNFDMI